MDDSIFDNLKDDDIIQEYLAAEKVEKKDGKIEKKDEKKVNKKDGKVEKKDEKQKETPKNESSNGVLTPRIIREIKIGKSSKLFYFLYDPDGEWGPKNCCYIKWKFDESHYKGETHVLRIDFLNLKKGQKFPANAPNIIFLTPMKHPHVFPDGSICVDTLGVHEGEAGYAGWSAMYNIETIFNTIDLLIKNQWMFKEEEVRKFYDDNILLNSYKKIRELVAKKFMNEN
jgi:ubiquitin-protein ligase